MKLELAIDVGSSHVTIYQKGKGVVLREPNVAIVNNSGEVEVIEVGQKAINMLGRADRRVKAVYPVSDGVIVHQEVFSKMLQAFMQRLHNARFVKPTISALVLISQCLNDVERKNMEKAIYEAGVRDVTLIESPLALYVQNGARDGLYVNIGADLTEVSIVTSGGIMSGYTLNVGGNTFNNLISDRITEKYGVKIGKYTAEKIKKTIGSMYENDMNVDEVVGVNIVDGENVLVDVNAGDVLESVINSVDAIIEVINTTLNLCPKEIAGKVFNEGVYLAGGTTLLPGLEEYILEKTKINVVTLENATSAVSLGGGKMLEDARILSGLLRLKNI